jgi:hypothetical protein
LLLFHAIGAIGFMKTVVKANAEPLGAFLARTKPLSGCGNSKRWKTLASNGALPKKHHGSSIHLSARGRSRILTEMGRGLGRRITGREVPLILETFSACYMQRSRYPLVVTPRGHPYLR